MAGNLLCSQDAATAAFLTKNKTVEADHEDHLRLIGCDGNYGYNLRRQFDKCTPVAKFALWHIFLHPVPIKCTPRSTNNPWGIS
jgi:hypothetical protein